MALPRGTMCCLQFVIVVFPDHTHYFYKNDPRVPPITTVVPEETLDPWVAKD